MNEKSDYCCGLCFMRLDKDYKGNTLNCKKCFTEREQINNLHSNPYQDEVWEGEKK